MLLYLKLCHIIMADPVHLLQLKNLLYTHPQTY
jgi:hypothetical protein